MKRSWSTRRYEIKYLVSLAQVPEIRERFLEYMHPDPNADPELNGYFNHSIYFDNPRMRYYLEKHEGMQERVKPRLRAYRPHADAEPSVYFMELKGRTDRVVFKQRERVSPELAKKLLEPNQLEFTDEIAASEALKRFYFIIRKFGVIPQVAVLYHRQPLQSSMYPGLRVTFDTRLQSSRSLSLNAPPSAFRYALPANTCVLEIKFNKKIPGIVLDDIRHFAIPQVTFSKFAVSLEANTDARGLRYRVYSND